jgi:hypothetical protein
MTTQHWDMVWAGLIGIGIVAVPQAIYCAYVWIMYKLGK